MTNTAPDFYTSRHARRRMQQRAINVEDAAVIVAFGDCTRNVGSNLVAVSLSRAAAFEIVADEIISADQARRLNKISVVVDDARPTLITALWRQGDRGRRYGRSA